MTFFNTYNWCTNDVVCQNFNNTIFFFNYLILPVLTNKMIGKLALLYIVTSAEAIEEKYFLLLIILFKLPIF